MMVWCGLVFFPCHSLLFRSLFSLRLQLVGSSCSLRRLCSFFLLASGVYECVFFFGSTELSFWNRTNRRQRHTLRLLCLRNGKRKANGYMKIEENASDKRVRLVHIQYPKLNENRENIECSSEAKHIYMWKSVVEMGKMERGRRWSCISEMPFRAKSGRLDIGIGLDDSTDKNDDAVFLLFWFYHQNKWLPFHSLPLTIRTYTHTLTLTQNAKWLWQFRTRVPPNMHGWYGYFFKQKW